MIIFLNLYVLAITINHFKVTLIFPISFFLFFPTGVAHLRKICRRKEVINVKYIIAITVKQNEVLQKMLLDKNYWSSSIPPSSVNELLKWSLEDYVDNYQSYLLNKKGED